MSTLRERLERHWFWVALSLVLLGFGGGVAIDDLFAKASGAVTITAARLEALEHSQSDLQAAKAALVAKDQELAIAASRARELVTGNQRLTAEIEAATGAAGDGASGHVAQSCALQVRDAVQRNTQEITQKFEEKSAARVQGDRELADLARRAIDERDASLVQVKACLFQGKGVESYPAFRKTSLFIHFIGNRAKDGVLIAKQLSPYFQDVRLNECQSCDYRASIDYPTMLTVGAATDLAALLLDLGYTEFEHPIIETGRFDTRFDLTLR